MNLRRQIAVRGIAVVGLLASAAGAQRVQAADPHRWAFGAGLDVGGLPDAFSSQCGDGTGNVPSIGAGFAAFFRPRHWLVLQGDARGSAAPATGCKVFLSGSSFEFVSTEYPRDVPTPPLLRSAVRVGLETSPGPMLVRATVGSGLIWSRTPTPFETAAIGIGSGGDGARVFAELEASVARLRALEHRGSYQIDPSGGSTIVATTSSVVLHPRWATVHVGVELPLGSGDRHED